MGMAVRSDRKMGTVSSALLSLKHQEGEQGGLEVETKVPSCAHATIGPSLKFSQCLHGK